MAKWTKYNNPHRRSKPRRKNQHSPEYREYMQTIAAAQIVKAGSAEDINRIVDAYNITMNP